MCPNRCLRALDSSHGIMPTYVPIERLLAELGSEVWMGDPAEIKAKRVIYAYNHHVRLLSPEPAVVEQPQSARVEEPTLLCNHVPLAGQKPFTASHVDPCASLRCRPRRWCSK